MVKHKAITNKARNIVWKFIVKDEKKYLQYLKEIIIFLVTILFIYNYIESFKWLLKSLFSFYKCFWMIFIYLISISKFMLNVVRSWYEHSQFWGGQRLINAILKEWHGHLWILNRCPYIYSKRYNSEDATPKYKIASYFMWQLVHCLIVCMCVRCYILEPSICSHNVWVFNICVTLFTAWIFNIVLVCIHLDESTYDTSIQWSGA